MKAIKYVLYAVLLVALLVGCANKAAIQQATADAQSTADALAAQQAQETRSAQATVDQGTAEAIAATANAQATQDYVAGQTATAQAQETATAAAQATGTADAQIAATANAAATSTARVALSRTETAKKILDATATAQPMLDIVKKLNADGYLKGADGTFYKIEDFDESWAQRNWYMYFPTSYNPTDFVLSADTFVETADKYAEGSGCGFVFHDQSTSELANHYVMWLDTEGYVVLGRMARNQWQMLTTKKTSIAEATTQSVHIDLVVEDNWFTYFVDGVKTVHWQESTYANGNLYLTLMSGTNKDYGTHCKMTNIWLWVIK